MNLTDVRIKEIMALSGESCGHVERNRDWLLASMHPYFFVAMNDEPAALATLARELGSLKQNRRLILADREKSTILARINQPGSLYETLRTIQEQEISYAMIAHSEAPVPGMEQELEIQRFEFDRKSNRQINDAGTVSIPAGIRSRIVAALKESYPGFELRELDRLLRIIWLNNENYVRISPPGGWPNCSGCTIRATPTAGSTWMWRSSTVRRGRGSHGCCSLWPTLPSRTSCCR